VVFIILENIFYKIDLQKIKYLFTRQLPFTIFYCIVLYSFIQSSPFLSKMSQPTSKNSETAKSGFKAEEVFRTNPEIKSQLEPYFQKKIVSMDKVHGEKYDTRVHFEDGTTCNIQNKKIENLGGRGDSFDRRPISNTFENQFIRKYLTKLTLARETKRETGMSVEQKHDFMELCNRHMDDIKQYIEKTLLGEHGNQNEYWCIMKTDKTFAKMELYMISSQKLFAFIQGTIKIDIKLKPNGTCLHLSPYIALQRKGGGNTDHSPNHIQAKLKLTQEILELCDKLL